MLFWPNNEQVNWCLTYCKFICSGSYTPESTNGKTSDSKMSYDEKVYWYLATEI